MSAAVCGPGCIDGRLWILDGPLADAHTRSLSSWISIWALSPKKERDRYREADVQGRKRPVATVIMHVWSVPHVQGRKRPVDNILTSNRQETGILTSNV